MYQPHKDGFSEAIALPWQFGNTSLPRDVTKSIFQYGRLVKSLNRTISGELPLFTQFSSTREEKTTIGGIVGILESDDDEEGDYDDEDGLIFIQTILDTARQSVQFGRDARYARIINAADTALKRNDGSIAKPLGDLGNIQDKKSSYLNISDHLQEARRKVYDKAYNLLALNPKTDPDTKVRLIAQLNGNYTKTKPQMFLSQADLDASIVEIGISIIPNDELLSGYNLNEREQYAIDNGDDLKLNVFIKPQRARRPINLYFKSDQSNESLRYDPDYVQMRSQLSDVLETYSATNHKKHMTDLLYRFAGEFMGYQSTPDFTRARGTTTFSGTITRLMENWQVYYNAVYK